jgi:hypothetical protein
MRKAGRDISTYIDQFSFESQIAEQYSLEGTAERNVDDD